MNAFEREFLTALIIEQQEDACDNLNNKEEERDTAEIVPH
jgi:hypothetical protein